MTLPRIFFNTVTRRWDIRLGDRWNSEAYKFCGKLNQKMGKNDQIQKPDERSCKLGLGVYN